MTARATTEEEAAAQILSGWKTADLLGRAGGGRNARRRTWEESYKILLEYVDEFGLLPVSSPSCIYQGFSLGEWVGRQRQAWKTIAPDRAALLDQVPGWEWRVDRDKIWRERFGALRDYVAEFKHLPPQGRKGIYQGVNLGNWINAQRRHQRSARGLSSEHAAALESLPGWYWWS
jgi:hypothetical protein